MLREESYTRTFLHVRVDTPPAVYIWDGKPASHPLRKLREGLGKDKAMRLASEAGIDRLDINALEKGKNKGNGAELVLRLAIPLFLTPQEMFDLLHFQLDPDEALVRARARQLRGNWDQLMAGVRPADIPQKSQLSKERRDAKVRRYAEEEKQATIETAFRRGHRARRKKREEERPAAPPSKRRAAG